MSEPTPALRGAVDLTSLGATDAVSTSSSDPTGRASAGGAAPAGLLIEGTDATFNQIVSRTVSVPAIAVVWSAHVPQSRELVETILAVASKLEGRLQVVSVDIAANPGLAQALRPPEVPIALGLVQGQPVPLFTGVVSAAEVRTVIDQLLALAVQHGVTGRLDTAPTQHAEEELSPLHQEAFDAIERDDLDTAASAYERALAENPKDADAALGLGQVRLMQRTAGVDLTAARSAAAAHPGDIDAQLLVADLDVLGGHIEDAFARLVDLVGHTTGDERARVKDHLISLFDVVGPHDERVRRGRTALMSALF